MDRFASNFENFGEGKKKCYTAGVYGSFLRVHAWTLHESKTKRNAFPFLGKHASQAVSNHFYAFLKDFEIFDPFIFFSLLGFSLLRYSV